VAGQIAARGPPVRWRGLSGILLWPVARSALYDAPTASTLTPHACSSLAAPGVHRLPCPSPVPVVVTVTRYAGVAVVCALPAAVCWHAIEAWSVPPRSCALH
jgi:hypothetical protein